MNRTKSYCFLALVCGVFLLSFQSCATESPSELPEAKTPAASTGTETILVTAVLARTAELSASQRLKYENMDVPNAFSYWLDHSFTFKADSLDIKGSSSFQLIGKQLQGQKETDLLYMDIWTAKLTRPLVKTGKRYEYRYALNKALGLSKQPVIDPVYLALSEGLRKQNQASGLVRLEKLTLDGDTLLVEYSVR